MSASERIEPRGALAISCDALANLIATSSQWQEWCGATSADEARNRIGIGGIQRPADPTGYSPEELKTIFPAAIIRLDDDEGRLSAESFGIRRVARGDYRDFGRLELQIIDAVKEEDADDDQRVYMNFLNRLGDLNDWIRLTADTNDFLAINRMYVKRSPGRTDVIVERTQGDFMAVTYVVEWGQNEGIGGAL